MNQENRTSPTLRQSLIIIILTMVGTLILVEGYARLNGLRPKHQSFIYDSKLGWRWNPGYTAIAESKEGYEYVLHISEQGLRDRVYEIPKPDGVTRILVLGDSVAAAQGVDIERSFVRELERSLAEDYPDVQVVNAGTSAYTTVQEHLWLQEYGMRFEPDLVILAYVMNDPDSFETPPTPFVKLYNTLQENSAAYGWYISNKIDREAEHERTAPDGKYRDVDNYASFAWKDDPEELAELFELAAGNWSIAWQTDLLEANIADLDALQRFVSSQGIPFLFVIIPPHPQVAALNPPPGFDMDKPQRILTEWAETQGVWTVDLLPAFRAHPADDLFHDHVHLSEEGHNLVAAVLADEVTREYLSVDAQADSGDDGS